MVEARSLDFSSGRRESASVRRASGLRAALCPCRSPLSVLGARQARRAKPSPRRVKLRLTIAAARRPGANAVGDGVSPSGNVGAPVGGGSGGQAPPFGAFGSRATRSGPVVEWGHPLGRRSAREYGRVRRHGGRPRRLQHPEPRPRTVPRALRLSQRIRHGPGDRGALKRQALVVGTSRNGAPASSTERRNSRGPRPPPSRERSSSTRTCGLSARRSPTEHATVDRRPAAGGCAWSPDYALGLAQRAALE